MKSLLALFAVLLAITVRAGIATDPYYQMVTLPTNIWRIHGTIYVHSPNGTNYFFASTRNDFANGYIVRFLADDITRYDVITFTNFPSQAHVDIPQLCYTNNLLYALCANPNVDGTWAVVSVNPDTLATNDVIASDTHLKVGPLASIDTDGTNLYILDGSYGIGKYSLAGAYIATNSFQQLGPPAQAEWKGSLGHEIRWDGTNLLVTGNDSAFPSNSLEVVNPDLTFNLVGCPLYLFKSNAVSGNPNAPWFPSAIGNNAKLTDDLCHVGPWVFVGDENEAYCGVNTYAINKVTGACAAIFTSFTNGVNYGTAYDGRYVWSIGAFGFITRIDPSTITQGVMMSVTYTLGTNRTSLNEMVCDPPGTTPVQRYFMSDFLSPSDGPTHVFRFSNPDLYTACTTQTNGIPLPNEVLIYGH